MKNIKNYFLDFGGVLYQINHQKSIEKFFRLSSDPNLFTPENVIQILNSPLLKNYESGKITSKEFRDGFREILKLKCSDEEFDDAWNATLIAPYPDSEKIVKSFAGPGNVYLLSNTSEIHYNKFEPECRHFFPLFKDKFFSFNLGSSKPDEIIFKKVIEASGVNPRESIFIDDTEVNVLAAEKAGFNTVHLRKRSLIKEIASEFNP